VSELLDIRRSGRADGEGVGLVVRVLGPTRVERDGDIAAIGGPRQRAVLARLVLADRQLVTADRLIEDVWGEDAPRTAVGTLHSHLSLLRRALGDGDLLRRDGPGYVLDIPTESVDAAAFELLTGRASDALATDPNLARETAEWALTLWRGPAYADVADTEWGRAAAVHLAELRLVAMQVRYDALIELGRHPDVIAELERAVDEHPMHERFTAQLMLSLYRSGRQVEALRTFDRTRERLVEELGIDPGPDLVRLQAAILDHEDWLAAPAVVETVRLPVGAPASGDAEPSGPPPASPVRLPAAALRHRDRPFVGRGAELGLLGEAWDGARAGHRRMVIVTGDAGAGKTRLVSRFVTDAHREGAIVMWGRATTEAIVPYEPIVEGLRAVLRSVSPEAQHRVVEGRDALSLLVPDLTEIVPGAHVVRPEVGTERYVLFETVADLLEAESADWPLVFVLDDLHLTDELSLRLLDHVLRHERPGRVLLIGTARTGPQTSSPHLEDFCATLHRDGLLTRLAVAGLEPEDVAELLAAGGWSNGGPGAQAIHRATGGNAFFVTELAQHGGATDDALPDSIRSVLDARLDRLDDQTSRLVALAAVAGPDAAIPVLARAGGFSGDEVLDCVDAAIREGVLTEDGPTGSVTFPHALVQQAVLERLTRSRRGALHLAVADGLAEAGDATRAELAHHLISAGPLAPRDAVVRAALDAGRDALEVLAYEDADRWARRAIEAAGSAAPPALRCEALLLRSDSQRALGDRIDARAAASEAADLARAVSDPVLLARAAEGLALARAGLGFDFGTEDPGLDALLEEALRALPADETSHRARLLSASMTNAAADRDAAKIDRLGHLIENLPDSTHPVLVATVHLARRMAEWRVHTLEDRIADDRAAREAAARAGNASLELNALLYGITDLTEAGLISEAAAWFERFRARAADLRQPVYDAFVLFIDATLHLLQGEYEESSRLVNAALEMGRKSHGPNAEQAWAGHMFVHYWDQGRLAELHPVLDGLQGPGGLPIWDIARAATGIAAGELDAARATLERLVDTTVHFDDNSLWLTEAALLVEVARALGDVERCEVLLRELTPYVGRLVISGLGRVSIGPVARYAGIAALATGRMEQADELFELSAKQCRELAAVPQLARSHHDWAAVKSALGDEAAAAKLSDRARALADRVGLVLGDLTVAGAAAH
jgi:DNA-binding SARP family transcriptional activator